MTSTNLLIHSTCPPVLLQYFAVVVALIKEEVVIKKGELLI